MERTCLSLFSHVTYRLGKVLFVIRWKQQTKKRFFFSFHIPVCCGQQTYGNKTMNYEVALNEPKQGKMACFSEKQSFS